MTVVTTHGLCLRQRDNSRSLERCFVAVDGISCREMLVGGTAEVQVRDPCTLTCSLNKSWSRRNPAYFVQNVEVGVK